jgi:hypothetical protein
LAKSSRKRLHCLGADRGQHQREGIIGAGLDCRKNIGEREAFIAQAWRALAAPPPDPTHPTFLTDPRLVLEKQANALAFMRMLNFFEQRRGSF